MKNLEKIKQDKNVKILIDIFAEIKANKTYFNSSCALCGGAIVDILEDRTPKDYDIVDANDKIKQHFISNGFDFVCESKTATTLYGKGITVQFLKRGIETFDFKISQSRFEFKEDKLTIDSISFENKTLIPLNFDDYESCVNSMMRIPKWQSKGYKIHPITYASLLSTITKQRNSHS